MDDEIADLFDELIDDMIADDWRSDLDLSTAADLLEIVTAVNLRRQREGRELVQLPLSVMVRLRDFIKHGRRDKGKPRDRHGAAKVQAADEAQALLHTRYGIRFWSSTIQRRMDDRNIGWSL
jgi:hypothetical protein